MAGESLIGNLAVLLTMETAAFEKGTSHASKLLRKTQRDFEAMATKFVGVGQKMSLAVTAPLVGLAAKGISEAQNMAKAVAQVDAALASMGPVAGRSSKQLKAAADAFEASSLFGAEDILQKVTANMLTFGNISGEAFDRAQQAAVDLSARLGQDLQSSAIQVGKALNDPIKGVTALQRVGVSFTEQQREQIKAMVEAGNAAGAQAMILDELKKQFGGAAQAAQDTDPWNKAADAFGNAAEKIGNVLLPLIPPLTDAVISVADAFANLSPWTQKFIVIAAGLAAALGPLLIVFGTLISAVGSALPLLIRLGPALGLAEAGAVGSAPALAALGPALGIVAAAALAVFIAYKNWDKIGPYIDGVVERTTKGAADINAKLKSIQDSANDLDRRLGIPTRDEFLTSLQNDVRGAVAKIDAFLKAIQDGAASMDRAIVSAFGSVSRSVQSMVTSVSSWLQKLSAPFNWVRQKASEVGDAFRTLYDRVVGHSYIPDMVDEIGQHMARLDQVMVSPVSQATSKAAQAFQDLQGRVQSLLNRLFPEQAAQNQFNKDLADLEAYARAAGLSVDQLAEAVSRLRSEYTGFPANPLPSADLTSAGDAPDRMEIDTDKMLGVLTAIPQAASVANDAIKGIAMDGIQTLADGLTAVIMGTAKLGDVFKAVAQQIIAGLIRIGIQKMLMSFASSIGIPGIPGRASGGPVSRNKAYIVGENGPELFMSGRSGQIIPNDKLGMGGGDTYQFSFPGVTNAREARQSGLQAANALRAAIGRSTKVNN